MQRARTATPASHATTVLRSVSMSLSWASAPRLCNPAAAVRGAAGGPDPASRGQAMSFSPHPAGRRAVRCAALACLLLAAAPPARPAPRAWPAPAGRGLQYLETGLGQLQRLERRIKRLGEDRQGAGALAAAALAAAGRPTGADAVRWTTEVLDACAGRWQRLQCQHAEIALQRIALQYPQVLPPPLLGRVRAQAVAAAPPPGPEAVADPWRFKDTENQRMLQIARSLGAQTLAGTPDSPAARAWGAYAEAFLAAHDRQGWYEAESPGYLASSITSLLHLADHAPQPAVRELAVRQLNLLFARWAQEQVGGFPAGAKSRTYVHWALGHRNTAWRAWAWLAGALPSAEGLSFMDWPELPASGYELPAPVAELLAERRRQPPYEVKARRRIDLGERMDLDVALYSYATPDYVLGTAQAVGGLRLSVSGGQEILATLFPECGFAPLYLWSRSDNPRKDRWRNWGREDLAVGHENATLARLGGPGRDRPRLLRARLVAAGAARGRRRGRLLALRRRLRGAGHRGRLGGGAGAATPPRLLRR